VLDNVPLLVTMVGLVVVGKMIIRAGIVRLFGETSWTALLTGVGLAQIGEFSFVLVQAARREGFIAEDIYQATLATSLITILLNATLVQLVSRYIGSLQAARGPRNVIRPLRALEGHVILCGYGRVGSAVAEALETFGVPHVVIETDPDIVRGLRTRGVPSLFGDASHSGCCTPPGPSTPRSRWSRFPSWTGAPGRAQAPSGQTRRCRSWPARRIAPITRAFARLGASEVIQPELEAASTLIRHALRRLDLPRDRVLAYLEQYREAMDVDGTHPEGKAERLPVLREVVLDRGPLTDRTLHDSRVRERFGVSVVAIIRPDGTAMPIRPPTRSSARATGCASSAFPNSSRPCSPTPRATRARARGHGPTRGQRNVDYDDRGAPRLRRGA
jgi:CPA2 family monovalent cation:H+ antiporter-2